MKQRYRRSSVLVVPGKLRLIGGGQITRERLLQASTDRTHASAGTDWEGLSLHEGPTQRMGGVCGDPPNLA